MRDKFCQKENDGLNFVIICGDIRLYKYLVTEIGNQNDPKFEAVLNFISGIIKGALNIVNIEGIVIQNVVKYILLILLRMKKNLPENQCLFTFNINVFSDNKELNENKTKL